MTLTLDSSAAYEVLMESSARADWLREYISGHEFVVPTLFRFEITNLIRKTLARNLISAETADEAIADALAMPISELDFDAIFPRAWAHHGSYTILDASYIAVAELTSTRLVTVDQRMADGPPVACEIVVPPV